jgi:hypothetical protein
MSEIIVAELHESGGNNGLFGTRTFRETSSGKLWEEVEHEGESEGSLYKSAAGASAGSAAYKSRSHLVSQITDHLEAGRHAEARKLHSELERLDGKATPAPDEPYDMDDEPEEREGKTSRDPHFASGTGGPGGRRRSHESREWVERLFGERPLRESRTVRLGNATIWTKKLL